MHVILPRSRCNIGVVVMAMRLQKMMMMMMMMIDKMEQKYPCIYVYRVGMYTAMTMT